MDPKVQAWYDTLTDMAAPLHALRAILKATPLVESFKWQGPCYSLEEGNVATVWSFKDRAAIGFFKGTLLDDPKGLLQAPGENSRAMRVLNFTTAEAVEAAAPAIRGFLEAAMALEKTGAKVEFAKDDLAPPEELTDALDADPALAAAWAALTPGRRRSWILHIGQAKQSATRTARLDKARPGILAGKGMNDR